MKAIKAIGRKALATVLLILLCISIKAETYSYQGQTKEYTNMITLSSQYEDGGTMIIYSMYDCYTANGKNIAVLVKCYKQRELHPEDIVIPSVINYNGQAYTVETIADKAFYTTHFLNKVVIAQLKP